jgi:hypothetical protein
MMMMMMIHSNLRIPKVQPAQILAVRVDGANIYHSALKGLYYPPISLASNRQPSKRHPLKLLAFLHPNYAHMKLSFSRCPKGLRTAG